MSRLAISRFFTFFAREGVGSPDQDLETQKKKLRALLAQGDGLADVPMDGAALFLNPQIQLEVNNPVIPVLKPEQVKDYVRARVKEARVPNATQKSLVEFLVAVQPGKKRRKGRGQGSPDLVPLHDGRCRRRPCVL